jgi:hypothetical protein
MEKFIVNSAVLSAGMDPVACAMGIPKMFKNQGISDVKVKSCYCCGKDGKMVLVAEAPNKETLQSALGKINVPIDSIMETKEVKPTKA